ncbi:chitinase CLP-like [Rhodamnia argentea]|uniref:Chitinase CLP-like n=1 Tax=Rhodamnia argentea TaxID=178133 RepID=A0A8B8PMT4_9MYRT|nr:chitinase CLP-like [Rhodamnia argentea]
MPNLLLLPSLLVLTLSLEVLAPPPYHTLVAPILKHTNANTSLYSITLNYHEHYVIDVDAPFNWYRCQLRHPPVGCNAPECAVARSYLSPSCPISNNTYKYGQCYCNDTPVNPVTGSCALSQSTYNDLIIYWTNGRFRITAIIFSHSYVSCAPTSLLQSLPKEAIGVGALSWSSLALLSLFTYNAGLEVARKFALCLPSSSRARGTIFIGDGPYYLLPPTNAASVLSYTPLRGDSISLGYFINLTGITINGNAINVPWDAFDFNVNGSARLSSIVPYTTLRSNIYDAFLKEFTKAVRGIAQVMNVDPFSLCFNTSTIGLSRQGLRVPQIDLILGNGEKWTIYGSNSIKQVDNDVGCLAFGDGGKTVKQAVVVGTYQMENNFLLFDLDQSRLGFSSSLLPYGTTCGGFNFTVGGIV